MTTVSKEEPQQRSVIERHAQTLIGVLLVGLVGWSLNTTNETARQVAVMTVQIQTMSERIGELQDGTRDRYTSSQAITDFGLIRERLADHEARIRQLETNRNPTSYGVE